MTSTLAPVPHTIDARIAAIAGTQYGFVAIGQLLEIGLSHGQVARLVRVGRLRRFHRGVYVIAGVPITERGRWMGAVLAGNEGTVLYGETALELHGAIRFPGGMVHVVTPGAPRVVPGVGSHRSRWLPSSQTWIRSGIPSSIPSRAIVDYGYHHDVYDIAGVLHELDFRRLLDLDQVQRVDERLAQRRGTSDLALAIKHYRIGSQGAYSRAELFLLRACRDRGLPLPVANQPVETPRGTFIVDAVWAERRCAYELDWKHGHDRPPAKAKDTVRDEGLDAASFRHIRLDVDRMYGDVDGAVDRVAELLGI